MQSRDDCLIVDPGAAGEGESYFKRILEILAVTTNKLTVFLTHHHHDHIEGIIYFLIYSNALQQSALFKKFSHKR